MNQRLVMFKDVESNDLLLSVKSLAKVEEYEMKRPVGEYVSGVEQQYEKTGEWRSTLFFDSSDPVRARMQVVRGRVADVLTAIGGKADSGPHVVDGVLLSVLSDLQHHEAAKCTCDTKAQCLGTVRAFVEDMLKAVSK